MDMRKRALLALVVALAALGCYHDKYNMIGPKKEEYVEPPDQARYNNPETAPYKPPPAPKEQDTLIKSGKGSGGGNGLGGF
jgi:hypothetical protein